MNKLLKLTSALFVASFLVLLHQYLNWGKWFEIADIHHETFATSLAFGGLVLFIIQTKFWRKW